jgi:intein/homing endonuclease
MIKRKDLSDEQEKALHQMLEFVDSTGRQMILSGFAGTGKCISGDSIIWNSTGLSRLKSLSPKTQQVDSAVEHNMDVLGFNQDTKKICNVATSHIWKESRTDGYNFILNKGYLQSVSHWHPIYCEIDGIQDYFKASDIYKAHTSGKSVWIPMLKGHPNWIKSELNTVKTKRFNIDITPDVAYVLGCLVGDGTLKGTTLNTTKFSNIDPDILISLNIAGKSVDSEFNIKRIGNTSCDWTIKSPIICDLIRHMSINTNSEYKFIPDDIISSPSNVISAFLCGLFDTDGSSNSDNGYIEYCTASDKLSIDVQNILLAFGIICRRKFRPNECKGAWHLYITGENAKLFYHNIGFRCIRKQLHENLLTDNFNSNDQLFPPTIAPLMEQLFKSRADRGVIDDLTSDKMLRYGKPNRKMSSYYVDYYQGRRTPSINKLKEFLVDVSGKGSEVHNYITDSKIWLKLESAKPSRIELYDLVVPETHSFIANGCINHNTTLVNVFLNEIKKKYRYKSNTCTAPTNEAVRVLSYTSGKDFDATIYKLLGLALVEEDGRKPYLKQAGKPKLEEYDLIIVDESSMIGDQLLTNIEEQLKVHPHIQLIYVGDIGQLPPINTEQDEANQLMRGEGEQTESKVFQLKTQCHLTQVQRCSADNPIIKTVTAIRQNFESPVDLFERTSEVDVDNESGIEFIDDRELFMEQMLQDFDSTEYKQDNNYVRAIAYTNKAVDALNLHIRRRVFKTRELKQFMVGENVIISSPVMKRINPKVTVIVLTVGERVRVNHAKVITDPEYGFRVWRLHVEDYESKKPETHVLNVIHQDDLTLYRNTLREFAADAKEKSIMRRVDASGKRVNVYSRFESWREYYAFKNEYSWVKYAYAMTTHKCVHPDTIINTDSASMRMKNIVPGRVVESGNHSHNDVIYKSITKHKRYVEVILKNGQILKCGLKHPILTFDGIEYKYINAAELSNSNYVCISKNEVKLNNYDYTTLPKFIDNRVDDKSTRIVKVDAELAWVMGALIGDGCYSYNSNSNRVDYTAPDDPDLLDRMYTFLTSHGMNARYLYRKNKPYTIMVESINFRNILSHFGFGSHTAIDKYLYSPLIQMPNELLKYLLQGLFDSDGNIQINRNKIRYTSASHKLVLDIQSMLLRFGIISSIYSQNSRHHTINISGKYTHIFKDKIGFTSNRNIDKLKKLSYIIKTDNDIIPNGTVLVNEFKAAYYGKYTNSQGVKGIGLNSPKMRSIGSKCSAIINGKLRLSVNTFNELHNILTHEGISLNSFDQIAANNYFYNQVKSVNIIDGDIELMELEVDSEHTYIANGIVVHNSQGSTIQRVYVVERDMNRLSWNNIIRNKLKYTAFTRASHLLRILQ